MLPKRSVMTLSSTSQMAASSHVRGLGDGLDVVEASATQSDDADAHPIVRAKHGFRLKRGDSGCARPQEISTVDID
ncbi:MAG: hypothetical protein WDO73_22480 [Ignavibacteriota bacterium]